MTGATATREHLCLVVRLLLLALAGVSVLTCNRSDKAPLAVVVFVYDENGLPISGADVQIRTSAPDRVWQAATEDAGTVTFTGLTEDEFKAVAGLRTDGPEAEFTASKDQYVEARAGVSGGDYSADNLQRGGRVHIDITLLQSKITDSSWAASASFTNVDLHAVGFFDSMHGWIVGGDGRIFFTETGGIQWNPQSSGTAATLTSVAPLDASHAWTTGAGAPLLKTADDGSSWVVATESTPLDSVTFSTPASAWAIGPQGIMHSVDQGLTWTLSLDPTTLALGSVTLTDIAFSPSGEGWVTGWATADDTGIVLHTVDGGATWSHIQVSACPLLAVAQVAVDEAWVVGCDAYKVQGGSISLPAGLPKAFQYFDVAATGFGEVWALGRVPPSKATGEVGPQIAEIVLSTVIHSEDGGVTWKTEYRGEERLHGLTLTGDGRGWIVGDGGEVLGLRQTTKRATQTPTPTLTPTPNR